MDAPRQMTRQRNLVGTSHNRYAYYHDVKDNYIYQLRVYDSVWIGWLCHLSVWERTFRHADWITQA